MTFAYSNAGQWYTYAVCYCNGLPFYVGKGTGSRVCQHYRETFSDNPKVRARHSEKNRIIERLNDYPGAGSGELYHLFLLGTEAEAYALEQSLISRWGIRAAGGLLTNATAATLAPFVETPPDAAMRENRWDWHYGRKGPRMVWHPSMTDVPLRELGKPVEKGCPACYGRVQIPATLLGVEVACPHCAERVAIGVSSRVG
jgi:hypothetical protein